MHYFDYIAIGLVALFLVIGLFRGFIKELFHFLALIGGTIGAFYTYPWFYEKLSFIHTNSYSKTVISFVIAFTILCFTIIFIGSLFSKIMDSSVLLAWIDSVLGGGVGIVKALLLLWVFTLSASLFPSSKVKSNFASSYTYKYLSKIPMRLKVPNAIELKKLKPKKTTEHISASVIEKNVQGYIF